METNVITPAGYKALEDKLEHLKVVSRREVAEKIKIAREFGDISENSEYDAAKEEQAMVEGMIIETENQLRTLTVVDEVDTNVVSVGCVVKLMDYEEKEELVYKIVGTSEADIANNKLSNESPIGRALVGRKKNSILNVETPGGMLRIKILDILEEK